MTKRKMSKAETATKSVSENIAAAKIVIAKHI